jgi:hypothetical protein
MTFVRVTFAAAVSLLVLACGVAYASAATPAPGWSIESFAQPTAFAASDTAGCLKTLSQAAQGVCDEYEMTARNAGDKGSEESPIVMTDILPAGLTVQKIDFFWSGFPGGPEFDLGEALCSAIPVAPGTPVECTIPPIGLSIAPDDTLRMRVLVTVDEPSTDRALVNHGTIVGGGAAEVSTDATTSPPNEVGGPAPAFGVSSFNFDIDGLDGTRDTQAGDHPYELTTTIGLNNQFRAGSNPAGSEEGLEDSSVQDPKDVVVDLPLGFVGSTLAAPECTFAQLSARISKGVAGCPPDTVVGHISTEPATNSSVNSAIYNMVPERGVPAEFAYVDGLAGAHVFYVHVVPTPEGYVLQTINPDIPQIQLDHIAVTFYGDPAERDGSGNVPIPFFTNPTGCANGPLVASIYMDSWLNPGRLKADGTPDLSDPAWVGSGERGQSVSPAVTGCNSLQFTPELFAQPTTHVADSPSGLEFEMKLPQTENAGVSATPALKRAEVTLPEGMTVDPSAGDGLQACSEAQIGWLGGSLHNFSPAALECPEASKIGSLELATPLIPGTLDGALYIARQNENPFGSVLAAYVVVDDPVTGVLIKLAGRFTPDPQTGRMTAVFDENPQLPFSDLKLHFFGGPRAELTTPEGCGSFTTTSDLAPWSAPDSGLDPTPLDTFLVESGCVNGFAPAFTAGSTNLQAGAYTPFVASFSRQDTDQELGGLSVSLPPGLLADVGSVPLCGEAQANAGTCPESTQVGTVKAGAGPGPNPLFVGGKAYLTGPYKGGPYGLSVVVPAIAGPFNFGVVVVRQSLRIDPTDAHVTDVSDPFPTILTPTGADGQTVGIPIRLRRIDVSIDRPGFTFNPTNCSKLQVSGSITSTHNASSSLASPFQVTNCATLKFQPKFAVSTAGKTTKADGASLAVKLTYPNTPQGTEANIAKVKVDLPKQLPSRLTTLQKACTAAQFNANPAGCPAASIIGHAKAITPILPVPLEGPAYFVSHGGEAFPSLILVLQGNGVTLDLVGSTFISKQGITSSTFKTVPDAPVGSFELTLPTGNYSALAANLPASAHGSFCGQTLKMPTEFLAQNGTKINQSTTITVSGCAKAKALTHAQKLEAALKACLRDKNKSKRQKCNVAARKKYGSTARKKRAGKKPKR